MIPLSTRTKEAIKTALAMTIAYGIALYIEDLTACSEYLGETRRETSS